MLISVIIPVFNAEKYVAAAIESVLAQAVSSLEIIVIDDGSTDASAQVLGYFGNAITYLYQANRGVSAARNRGIKLARGKYISFLDADDLLPQGKLNLQLAQLEAHPEAMFVLGKTKLFFETKENAQHEYIENQKYLLYSFAASLFRREVFEQVGYLNEAMNAAEDIDWFARARESQINALVTDDVVLLYRRHQHNTTHSNEFIMRTFMDSLKKSLDRRRSNPEKQVLKPFSQL